MLHARPRPEHAAIGHACHGGVPGVVFDGFILLCLALAPHLNHRLDVIDAFRWQLAHHVQLVNARRQSFIPAEDRGNFVTLVAVLSGRSG